FGSPVAITPYTLMQAITAEGDVVVSGATEPEPTKSPTGYHRKAPDKTGITR
ncbi:hypothetical protein ECO9553_02436, partial [Escherichia coli O111:H11 str. CVM9553]